MKYLSSILLSVFSFACFGQWTEQATGTKNHLNALQFLNGSTGFAVGDNGTFLKTTNGGTSWTLKSLPSAEPFADVNFIDGNTGFICSSNHLYKTTNGGTSFVDITSELLSPTAPAGPMNQIQMFFSGKNGIVTALWYPTAIVAIKTNDGGATWKTYSTPRTAGFAPIYYSIISNDTVYASGGSEQFKTVDNGVNWTSVRTQPNNVWGDRPFRVFNGKGRGFASYLLSGFMHMSSDASEMTMPPTGSAFHSFSFLNADTGFVMRDNEVLKTTDAGMTFGSLYKFPTITKDFNKWHICFVNRNTGFVCGQDGKMYKMSTPTAIGNQALQAEFRLYPNPVNGILHIDCSNNTQVSSVTIYDVAGRAVRTVNNNLSRIDVSDLNAGTYWLEITSGQGSVNAKIVVR